MQTFLGSSHIPPHKHLIIGPVTSLRWQLAFVFKEPIHCYVNVDTSVVCHVLMHCLGMIFASEGQNFGKINKNFSVICLQPAFNIAMWCLAGLFH